MATDRNGPVVRTIDTADMLLAAVGYAKAKVGRWSEGKPPVADRAC
jgi:hypothetical protein